MNRWTFFGLILFATGCGAGDLTMEEYSSLIKGNWQHETQEDWLLYFSSKKLYDYSLTDTIETNYHLIQCDSAKVCFESWFEENYFVFKVLKIDQEALVIQQDKPDSPIAVFYRLEHE